MTHNQMNLHRKEEKKGGDAHLFSAASMLMASMMSLTFSVICLALIVCCSNFVFTADCEIHSCEAMTHTGHCDRQRWREVGGARRRGGWGTRTCTPTGEQTEDEIDACCLNSGVRKRNGQKKERSAEESSGSSRACISCPGAH